MGKYAGAGTTVFIVAALMSAGASPAVAVQGEVVVFELEEVPLTIYQNPSGCQKLPAFAHVLANNTDSPVTVYGDPLCLTPGLVIQPGYGSHVAPGSGCFSA
jgi:hypothetical protein